MIKILFAAISAAILFQGWCATADPGDGWQQYGGKAGPSGWRCHVIFPDPRNDGPDGINLHDWNGDGHLDVFSNAEEGAYSRLYFNPGPGKVRDLWDDYVEFRHGKCEDSGMGDLDNDGDMDYIANGNWIYFNPGQDAVRDASKWIKMTLPSGNRVPTVADVDGDGLNDLILGGEAWFRQPVEGKHEAANWEKYAIGNHRWPMACILSDVDGDGDEDLIVPSRGMGTFWYEHPGPVEVTNPWKRRTLHGHKEPLGTAMADLNGDGMEDLVIAGGDKGALAKKLIVLLRENQGGEPRYEEVILDQPCGDFPKGVAVLNMDDDDATLEIVVIPKHGDLWMARYTGDPGEAVNWELVPLTMPGAETRHKMDHGWTGDVDGDGDIDIVTTEENGGWGVIWFENPGHGGGGPDSSSGAGKTRGRAVGMGEVLYEDDFSGDLGQWVPEQQPGGTVEVANGVLEIDDAKGCTTWFRPRLSGPLMIEYEVRVIDEGGPHDRVSDLNCFWMAIDPENPDDLFARGPERQGKFGNYHALRLYYVGYGGHGNSKTRFRRYPGGGERPLLPEHDLVEEQFMIVPNTVMRIRLVANGETIQYWRDGELLFELIDEDPFTSGWFGFRTVKNHLAVDNFRVTRLEPEG
jgi:hypothetical protein